MSMTRLLVLAATAAAPLLWAGAASALPVAPLAPTSNITDVRTICDAWGRCCATGSGECFYQGRPRREYYRERRFYGPPAYGYRERYDDDRRYYDGPSVRFGW